MYGFLKNKYFLILTESFDCILTSSVSSNTNSLLMAITNLFVSL